MCHFCGGLFLLSRCYTFLFFFALSWVVRGSSRSQRCPICFTFSVALALQGAHSHTHSLHGKYYLHTTLFFPSSFLWRMQDPFTSQYNQLINCNGNNLSLTQHRNQFHPINIYSWRPSLYISISQFQLTNTYQISI